MANNSPCSKCSRVKYPNVCENKSCPVWQGWFISWWDSVRSKYNIEDILAAKTNTSDIVEVTRCMNCRSYDPDNSECTIKFDSNGERLTTPPYYYCADGKRKTNDD